MPENPYVVKTIVTTPLAAAVAESYGVKTKDVLTGFKYIGETIDRCEGENYIFGMEESYGYLVGEHARDKDAVSAVMTLVEAYCYYAEKGLTLPEAL
ncbi:MAG: phospho-sugar mutase, partial [Clostridia bacterium]|nr:phospho-sugar mutase [Clostridia bacterium]